MQLPELAPLKLMKMPDLKPIETESKKQSLQEWHAAGGGVPLQYKGREHVWHAKVKKFSEGGEAHMGAGGVLKKMIKSAIEAPTIIVPSRLSETKEAIRQKSGDYAARRLERAADEIPNLEKLYKEEAIRRAFTGDNAKAVATMKPKDFQKYAIELKKQSSVGPEASALARKGDISKSTVPTDEYIKHLQRVRGGFDDIPYLDLFKDEVGIPSKPRVRGHEGRHRNMAMAENEEPAGLVQVYPRGDLREGLPRRHQDEYINALREELDLSGNLVFPESRPMYGRPPIKFPDVYAEGGEVHMAGGGDPLDEFSPPRYRSAGRRPESQNDRRAAANMPIDFARGVASGVLGAPGDIESLVRMIPGFERSQKLSDLVTGDHRETYLPTSEDIEKRIPLRSDTPAGRAASGLGILAGGFYGGPGAPIRLVGGLPQAVYKAGKDFGRAAGQPAANVVKPKGGNFFTGTVEKNLKSLEREKPYTQSQTDRAKEQLERAKENLAKNGEDEHGLRGNSVRQSQMVWDHIQKINAINKWVESNLTNYVKKQMATPDDPIRALAEQGITHKADFLNFADEPMMNRRKQAGFPEGGMAQSPQARAWEMASDDAIQSIRAGDIQDAPGKAKNSLTEYRSQLGLENPWVNKLDPNTQVYIPINKDLGFDHIMDVLREDLNAGRIRPEQMNKISITDAVRRTHQYDQEMAKKMAQSQAQITEGMPIYKEYPEGYKWIELAQTDELPAGMKETVDKRYLRNEAGELVEDPRYKKLESALKYEGDQMGHCVGGYCPDVSTGRARIYSLRDAKGKPHVTVEVQPKKLNDPSKGLKQDANVPQELKDEYQKAFTASGKHSMDYATDFWPWLQQSNPEEFAKLTADLSPKILQIKGKGNRAPKEEYLPYVQDFVKGGEWSEIRDLQNTGLKAFESSEGTRYLTEDEYLKELHKELGIDPPSQGMAKGGVVHMQKGGKSGALVSIAEAVAAASKKADEILAANKAALEASSPENYSKKVLGSTAAKFADKIAEAKPKMNAEEIAKKAMTQATKKLDWERTQKPALVKQYGPLTKASYAKSNPTKQRNTPAVVEERMRKANEFLDQPTEAWKPPKPELQAFDRSSIKDALEGFPGVEQSKFPRDIPSRANIEHVEGLYTDPANRALIEKQIKRGLPLGGESFYASLYPVKQAVLEAGMPAEKFDQWIYGMAPASARNSIMNEMAVGQFLRQMNARGIPLTEENVAREMAIYADKFGMGLPLMPVHREGVAKVLEGGLNLRDQNLANIPTNYKIPTYGSQKAGDFANSVVLDVHEAAGHTQGSRYHPYFNEQGGFGNTEYNAGEQGLLGIAKDLGIPGGMAQAGRWFGGGELTGLKSPRGDALDLLEKQVAYTLQQKGIQPNPANVRAEVLRQIETGEGDLLPWYRKEGMPDVRQTGLQRAEGGEIHKAEGGLIEERRFDGGGMAAADFAGPGDDGGSLDKAKLMSKILAEEAKKQGSKEVGSLNKPRALTDLLNRGVLANNPISAGIDLLNMGLIPLDILGSKLTGRDIKVSSDKPFLGSEHVKDLMNKYNVTSGEDRPMMETALSFASPTAMIKGAMKAPGAVTKVTEALTSSKMPPLATEAKTAQAGKPTGATYATKQEGPFFRVTPTNLDTSAAKTRGTKEAVGLPSSTPDGGGAEQSGREVPKFLSSEEVGRIIADPVANEPLNIAKKYTQDTQGVDFGVPQVPSSSLAKQSGIARTFDLAVQGSPEYKSAIFGAYGRQMPDLMEKIGAKNYDDLMEKAYRQMAKETDEQFRRLPYNFSYHRAGEGNYNGAKDMASDVHGNKHLYVYQGGDKHDFLHNVDPQSGLNENEKFRAVHDLLGHAIYGNEFGPKGEEMAWAVHQQMYSPLARMAMTAETRGQNSVVNYSPLNAKLKATIAEYERLGNEALRRGDKKVAKEIAELKKQAYFGFEFAPNKAVLLPPEFMNPRFTGGIPDYLAAVNQPTPGTFIQSPLTHFSNEPGLTFTDPRKYGTGIKGAEADRLMNYPGAVRDRSYFYMGEPGTVSPEPGLGVNRYRGEASSLYDITQDPLDFQLLAREANRTPYTSKANQGVTYPLQNANDVERMVKEYGYQGMANPKATKPMAIMFKETPVRRQARGGLSSIK